MPTVRANLAALHQQLTDTETGVPDADRCLIVDEPASVAELGRILSEIAGEPADLLPLPGCSLLDCCFSGRAIDVMADERGLIAGQLDIAGT